MRTTLRDLRRMKETGQRIAMLTAYDHPSARIAERAGVPMLLVGDSLGMVVHGHDTTLPVEAAGAFAVVLERVPAPLAEAGTQRLRIPTIGIGAGAGCAGQGQVWHDLLGLGETSPRHAKRYAEIGAAMEAAIRSYVEEGEAGAFPTRAQSAGMDA